MENWLGRYEDRMEGRNNRKLALMGVNEASSLVERKRRKKKRNRREKKKRKKKKK